MNIRTKRGKMVNGFDPAKVDQLDAQPFRSLLDQQVLLELLELRRLVEA